MWRLIIITLGGGESSLLIIWRNCPWSKKTNQSSAISYLLVQSTSSFCWCGKAKSLTFNPVHNYDVSFQLQILALHSSHDTMIASMGFFFFMIFPESACMTFPWFWRDEIKNDIESLRMELFCFRRCISAISHKMTWKTKHNKCQIQATIKGMFILQVSLYLFEHSHYIFFLVLFLSL